MADTHQDAPNMLSQTEQGYRAIVENAFDLIQSCRPDGSFEFVNQAWLEKLGYTADEVADLNVWDVIHQESQEHCREMFGRAINGESISRVHATFVRKDGQPLPLEGNASSRFVDNRVVATHSFFRDITERLRGEELEKRNLELEKERVIRSFEKMAALGRLSAGLAHELNNPAAAAQRASDQAGEQWRQLNQLTIRMQQLGVNQEQLARLEQASLRRPGSGGQLSALARADREDQLGAWLSERGFTEAWDTTDELVSAGFDTAALAELTADMPDDLLAEAVKWLSSSFAVADLLDTIMVSTRTISDLVGAVKDYSYMDREQQQEIDVHDGLESTLRILQHKTKGSVQVERNYDRSLPRITVAAGELNQVWTNLIDNAIDAAGDGGVIRVSTYESDGALTVEVGDNGGGIPEEARGHIFEAFYTTKEIGKGSGIGLDVARRIVTDLCGGEIDFESQPGDTRFRVRLPLYLTSRQSGTN